MLRAAPLSSCSRRAVVLSVSGALRNNKRGRVQAPRSLALSHPTPVRGASSRNNNVGTLMALPPCAAARSRRRQVHVQRRVRVVPRAMAGGGGGGGLIPLVLIVLILFTPVGKAILDLSALLFFAPLVLLPLGFLGLQFWAKQNVVTGDCPVCGSNVSGVKNQDFPCLSCGTVLTTESDGTFRRKNPTFDPSGSQSASSPFSSSGSPGGSTSQANASSASSRTGGPAQEPGTGRKTWKGGGKGGAGGQTVDVDADVIDI